MDRYLSHALWMWVYVTWVGVLLCVGYVGVPQNIT
jgi:hypothetical protein